MTDFKNALRYLVEREVRKTMMPYGFSLGSPETEDRMVREKVDEILRGCRDG